MSTVRPGARVGDVPAQLPLTAAELTGPHLRLGPLTEADCPDLARVLMQPEVYAHGYVMHERPTTYEAALAMALAGYAQAAPPNGLGHGRTVYAIRLAVDALRAPAGTFVGTSSLGDFVPERESAHLGWTLYDSRFWSTFVNPEAKLVLLTHAFETLGYGRVKIQTDILNTRSQAAIAKLGAVREGVLRRDVPRYDGTWRDTVVFGITVDDWPSVKRGLQARLA
ncbi:MAG: GNAT family N-acetyltransferase [Actinobacteria bacterium]|nr:GNAT family N-acetyltransferase [Actinomycetota bacterium]